MRIFLCTLILMSGTVPAIAQVASAPTNFTITYSDGRMTLSWAAPSYNGSHPISEYEYSVVPSGSSDSWISTFSHLVLTVGNIAVLNGTTYSCKVRAVTGAGDGAAAEKSVTPTIAAPANFSVTAGDGEVTLSWDAVTEAHRGYQYKQDDGDWTPDSGPFITTRSKTITGLTNGTEYTFAVRGINNGGGGTASGSKSATPNIAAPTGLKATEDDGQVTLIWTAPSLSPDTITHYQYSQDGTWQSAKIPKTSTTGYTVGGLINGVIYTFRVRAVGAGGAGTASNSVTATPQAPQPPPEEPEDTPPQQPPPEEPPPQQPPPEEPEDTPPQQPPVNTLPPPQTQQPLNTLPLLETNPATYETLIVKHVGNPTVNLSWNIPTPFNPQAILEYHYSMDAGQTWTPTGTTNTSITINGDTVATLPMNQFKVRAISLNADGTARLVIFILIPPQGILQECPVGWVRSDGFAGRNRRVLIYEVNLQMDMSNLVSIYKPIWVAIYVHPDEGLETLDGWKLQVALPYNHHRDYLLTAENSLVVDAGFVEGGFAFIENPEEDPFPMVGIGFTGAPAPGFDYRLYDETGKRVDLGISCYKRGDIFPVLKEMEDPRVLRNVLLETLNWDALYIRSEWTVPIPAPAAPSLVKKTAVGTWADLKKE